MITVKGRLYSERWDTDTILDEQETFRRDPVDNPHEQILFRPPCAPYKTRSALSQEIRYRNLLEKLRSRGRENRMKRLPLPEDR